MPRISDLIEKSNVINEQVLIYNEKDFSYFARMTTPISDKCSFLCDEKYVKNLDKSIKMVITNEKLYNQNKESLKNYGVCISANPKGLYFELLNEYETANKRPLFDTQIGKNVRIASTAIISPHNVIIGDNCVIDDFVKIEPNVEVGCNTVIQTGSVIGIQDYNLYDYEGVTKQIYHNGQTFIGKNCFIGCHCVIGQALYSYGKTIVGDHAKINHGVLIGHNDNIGEDAKICKGAMLAGYVSTGKHCFFGVGAMVRNDIALGDNVTVGMGSVVTKNFESGVTIVGNPAHPK